MASISPSSTTPVAILIAVVALLSASCTASSGDEAVYDGASQEGEPDELAATDQDEGNGAGDDALGDLEDLIVDDPRIYDPENIPEVDMPDLASPDEVLPELDSEVSSAIVEAVESDEIEILDVAGIIDDGPTAEEIAGFGDGNPRHPSGELIALDDSASLACANTELALFALDDGDVAEAADQATTASDRAAKSEVAAIAEWADALAASVGAEAAPSVDPNVLVGFLGVCVEGGHSL